MNPTEKEQYTKFMEDHGWDWSDVPYFIDSLLEARTKAVADEIIHLIIDTGEFEDPRGNSLISKIHKTFLTTKPNE